MASLCGEMITTRPSSARMTALNRQSRRAERDAREKRRGRVLSGTHKQRRADLMRNRLEKALAAFNG